MGVQEVQKFQGWVGLDKESANGNLKYQEYEPKKWQEDDVDIKITHCGVCGSDLHTLRSGWGPTMYPCVVGHEIVGTAVRVGSKAQNEIKVGDRVGVGAQSDSCLKPDCEPCSQGLVNHCPRKTDTYNGKYADGSKSYGGYAEYARVPSRFVFKIPDAIPSEEAAPMLCGGITVFSPLQQNGAGPGKKVGIIGIGGLGHFGLLFAKALGADEVVAISRSSTKKADALKMGADKFIATEEDKDWVKKSAMSLDLIVCTVSQPSMPLADYLKLLRLKGRFVQVGAPEEPLPQIPAFSLIMTGVSIGGSMIGTPEEIKYMLDLAAKKNVHAWIQTRPMKEANKTIVDMDAGKARYRFVLVNQGQSSL